MAKQTDGGFLLGKPAVLVQEVPLLCCKEAQDVHRAVSYVIKEEPF